jgi:hypothetical protein
MKKLGFLLLAIFLFSGVVLAQKKWDDQAKLAKEMDLMTKSLSLTTEQVALITPLLKEAQLKQTALLKEMCCDSNGQLYTDKNLSDASKKITADLDLQIGAVISKSQLIKLQSVRESQRK